MRREETPGRRGPGAKEKTMPDGQTGKGKPLQVPTTPSGTGLLSFAPSRQRTRSPFRADLMQIVDDIRRGLKAGQPVCETDLCVGRYRANPVKAFRLLARLYPDRVKLVLDAGLWYLIPVKQPEVHP